MKVKCYQICLNEEETRKLDEVAREQERSRSFLVRKAIQNFLKEADKNANLKLEETKEIN